MAVNMAAGLLSRQESGPLPPPPPKAYLDENLAPAMLAVQSTLFGLAMLCVLLRMYVRAVILKTFGADDWMMVFSMTMSTTCFSLFVTLTHNGIGRHVEYLIYVRPDFMVMLFKIAWWYAWIIVIAYSSVKISIACFLLRLTDHRRGWRWTLHGIIVVLVLFTLGSALSLIFQCIPISAAWDFSLRPPLGHAKCYSPDTYRNTGVFNSIFNAITDLVLAIFPVPMIWKLRTTARIRLSLCMVLGLGLFAGGVAIYKIPLQYNFFDEKDFSGKGAWYYVWQQIEMNTGIIAACLPTLKPLAAEFFGAVSALTTGERYGSRYVNRPSHMNISKGYQKQQENNEAQSYVMGIFRSGNPRLRNESPFDEEYEESHTVHKRSGNRTGESEESIIPFKGIMRTTEVQIS